MSLLRQAVQCFASQQKHQLLNAFIPSPIEFAQKYVDEAASADARSEAGINVLRYNYNLFINQ